jgi:hypothetical protein
VVAQTRAAAERHLAQAKSFGRAITERWLEFGRSSIGSK